MLLHLPSSMLAIQVLLRVTQFASVQCSGNRRQFSLSLIANQPIRSFPVQLLSMDIDSGVVSWMRARCLSRIVSQDRLGMHPIVDLLTSAGGECSYSERRSEIDSVLCLTLGLAILLGQLAKLGNKANMSHY